jgi:hypothetical protein
MKQWIRVFVPLAVLALLGGFALARTASAAAPEAGTAPLAALPAGLEADAVIDAQEMTEVVDLTKRITPYLVVGDDGLVRLKDATAAEIGVSEEFLANYKAAMEFSNQLIARGEMTVAPDMRTTMTSLAGSLRPGAGLEPGPRPDAVVEGAADAEGAAPTWGGWDYGQGAMFYSSYNDWTYYRYNYYPLCNSMAAYIYRPWMSTSVCNYWGYNQQYFQNYCYSNYGMYYYMPYQYCCQTNYGCNSSHKPMYLWTRSYYYQSNCRCYQYNWAWQLMYARY